VLPQGAFPNQAAAVPSEPSLGVAIDQMEPVGTYAEIEKSVENSLAALHGGEGIDSLLPPSDRPSGDGEALRGSILPAAVSRPRRRLSKRKG
jgi:hypothetical protein